MFEITDDPTPLRINEGGVVLVGQTRVPLDTVIRAFKRGASAEEIAHRYTALNLADVYAVIGFYLRHRPEVESYLEASQARRAAVRAENEARFPQDDLRERLLARVNKLAS